MNFSNYKDVIFSSIKTETHEFTFIKKFNYRSHTILSL